MEKHTESAAKERRDGGYERVELSPTTEYFLYGRGGGEEYAREIRRIKSELRETAYGEYYDYEAEEEERKKKKRVNAAGIVVFAAGILSIIIMALGRLTGADGWFFVTEGTDAVTLINGLFGNISALNMDFGFGVCAAAAVLFSAAAVIGGAACVRSAGVGKLMRAGTFLWFCSELTLAVLGLIDMQSLPEGLFVILILSLTAVLAAAFGGKKKRR